MMRKPDGARECDRFRQSRSPETESAVNELDFYENSSKPLGDEPAGSITRWLGDLKAGDGKAFQPLWERYYAALVERANAKLQSLHASTAASDEEDLALSAFQSLYQ